MWQFCFVVVFFRSKAFPFEENSAILHKTIITKYSFVGNLEEQAKLVAVKIIIMIRLPLTKQELLEQKVQMVAGSIFACVNQVCDQE